MISSRAERVTQALATGHQDRGLIIKIHGFNDKRTESRDEADAGGRRRSKYRSLPVGCWWRLREKMRRWVAGLVGRRIRLRAPGERKVLSATKAANQETNEAKAGGERLGYQGSQMFGLLQATTRSVTFG